MPVITIQKAMMKRAMEEIGGAQVKGATKLFNRGEIRERGQEVIKRASRMEKLITRKYPEELAAGIKVEMEHTSSMEIAKIIALDHLSENPQYYTKLAEAGLVDEPEAMALLPVRIEKADWKEHKYIKKVGNKYFYTIDEIRDFRLQKRKDGFYYMDDMKITNDPEKARQFEEKVREHKAADTAVKIGDKVQIKGTHKGSYGRGIVAMVKEIEEGFARVVDEAGRYFRVPTSALVFAKSIQGIRWEVNSEHSEFERPICLVIAKSLTWSGHKLQGRTKVHGMDISIENRRGSVRRGVDKDGHEWTTKMHFAYGYVRGTVGADKDHLDCYIGPNPESTKVFVIHQNDPVTGKYDEDKCMIGFDTAQGAKAAYMKQYDRPGFFGSMDETDIDSFKAKVFSEEWKGRKVTFK